MLQKLILIVSCAAALSGCWTTGPSKLAESNATSGQGSPRVDEAYWRAAQLLTLDPSQPAEGVKPRRLASEELTAKLALTARGILKEHRDAPLGTEVPFSVDEKRYIALIERHYHPEGGALRPWGYHKGVSLLVLESPSS